MNENLNIAQFEAVTTTEGFVRVIAGAGSGKTRALTHRFAYLVSELGIMPGNILCVTFTNKAAQEMRRRIHNLTGDNDTGLINTFHGFCSTVLDEEIYAVQYPAGFIVLDNSDIDQMLKTVYEERGLTLRDMTFSDARDMIEMQKLYKRPEYYLDLIDMSVEMLHEKYLQAETVRDMIFYGYLYQEKKCFGLDYNDLLKFVIYIFRQNEDIRLKWQKRLEYIMIDEFQDIDFIQYELMDILCAYHKNLFVVGDPDQTIYSWRGADVRYLLNFDRAFPGAVTIMMNDNYRSTPEIIACANSLIGRNTFRMEKNLVSMLQPGCKPLWFHGLNGEKEAEWISQQVMRLKEAGVPASDIAVLYRAHYISRNLEERFLQDDVAYHIYSGVQFFDRMEIKDTLSYLRMAVKGDDLSFLRVCNVPKRNLGQRRIAFLQEYADQHHITLYRALKENLDHDIMKGTKAASFVSLIDDFSVQAEHLSVSELLAAMLDKSGYELMLRTEGSQERLDNLAELKQSVHDFEISCGEEADVVHYLDHVALFTNQDEAVAADKIRLMTVHAAKGLEFPYVFLCGMNEDMFPSKKISTLASMEEERRLAFVALTRAQKMLYLSDSGGRTFDGAPRYPSRFLLDIDEALIEKASPVEETLIADARTYIDRKLRFLPENKEKMMFRPGTRVIHDVFGPGTVVDSDAGKGVNIIHFDRLETDRALNFRAKLVMEKN